MQSQCVVRINALEYDVRVGAMSNTSGSRRYRIECTANGNILCRSQCNTDAGLYSVGTPSNATWVNPSPPTPRRSMQMAAHAEGCEGVLSHYANTPYTRDGRGLEGSCIVCDEFVERDVYHCSRCWYDVCGVCAEALELSRALADG